jgi:hypothetical protein
MGFKGKFLAMKESQLCNQEEDEKEIEFIACP